MNATAENMKLALRKFASAVSIISLRDSDGKLFAITATAVNILTLDPPTFIACINQASSFSSVLTQVDHFSINLLSEDQIYISEACAGKLPQGERASIGTWGTCDGGVPYLEGSQASFICKKASCEVHGTHYLVLGEVLKVKGNAVNAPLIYCQQKYGKFLNLAVN